MLCWSKKKLETTTSILNLNSKLLQEDFNCFCWTNETVSESTGSSVWFLLLLKFITGLTSYQIKLLIYFHSGVQTTTLGKALKQSFCMVVFCSQPSNRPEVSWGGFKDSDMERFPAGGDWGSGDFCWSDATWRAGKHQTRRARVCLRFLHSTTYLGRSHFVVSAPDKENTLRQSAWSGGLYTNYTIVGHE